MISRTFITEYLKLFFPNYDERYLDLLEIISDFTDPYIEASNINVVTEMVDMINIAREYESNQKIVNAVDDMLGKMVSISEL